MRTWKPLSKRELTEIIADTERDYPDSNYCPDDVYRLAREVEYLRGECKRLTAALRNLRTVARGYGEALEGGFDEVLGVESR